MDAGTRRKCGRCSVGIFVGHTQFRANENMKRISLTQGQFATVDNADFEWLNQWKWHALLRRNGKFHARRTVGAHPNQKQIYIHRIIFGATSGEQIDHKNGNSLDNRRRNLRRCSTSQNSCNRGAPRTNTSGFKGVSWHKQLSMWRARIGVCSRDIYLGLFSSAVAASRAYKAAARKYHGEFARI